jgi:hypothetical protein
MKSETEIILPLFDAGTLFEIAMNPVSSIETAPEATAEVLNLRGVPDSALHD